MHNFMKEVQPMHSTTILYSAYLGYCSCTFFSILIICLPHFFILSIDELKNNKKKQWKQYHHSNFSNILITKCAKAKKLFSLLLNHLIFESVQKQCDLRTAGPILERKGIHRCDSSEKGQRNVEKGENIWKFG